MYAFGHVTSSFRTFRAIWLKPRVADANLLSPAAASEKLSIQTKQACKPGSVVDNHLSGTLVTERLKPFEGKRRAALEFPKLLRMGFTRDHSYLSSLCALTAHFHTYRNKSRRLFSVALSLKSPSPAVSRHPALWSPDFPHT